MADHKDDLDRVEFYKGMDGQVYWRYRAAENSEVIGDGAQGYSPDGIEQAVISCSRVTNRILVDPEDGLAQSDPKRFIAAYFNDGLEFPDPKVDEE